MLAPLALLLLAAAPSEAPRTRPSRDVVVSYRVEGDATRLVPGGLPGPVTLSWDASGQRLRAEADGLSQIALLDLRARTGQAVDNTLRIALPLPLRPDDLQPLTLDGAHLTPAGRDTVGGLACNVYQVEVGQGTSKTPGTVCLTPDGVPLRGEGIIKGKPGSFTATSVRYARLPSELFTVPPGYMSLGAESGGGGLSLKSLRRLLGPGQ